LQHNLGVVEWQFPGQDPWKSPEFSATRWQTTSDTLHMTADYFRYLAEFQAKLASCASSMPVTFCTKFHLKVDIDAHVAFKVVPECRKQMEVWSRGCADAKANRTSTMLARRNRCLLNRVGASISRYLRRRVVFWVPVIVRSGSHCLLMCQVCCCVESPAQADYVKLCMIDKLHSGTHSHDLSGCLSPPLHPWTLLAKHLSLNVTLTKRQLNHHKVPGQGLGTTNERITKVVNAIGSHGVHC